MGRQMAYLFKLRGCGDSERAAIRRVPCFSEVNGGFGAKPSLGSAPSYSGPPGRGFGAEEGWL
jgi:hypothetical protein